MLLKGCDLRLVRHHAPVVRGPLAFTAEDVELLRARFMQGCPLRPPSSQSGKAARCRGAGFSPRKPPKRRLKPPRRDESRAQTAAIIQSGVPTLPVRSRRAEDAHRKAI